MGDWCASSHPVTVKASSLPFIWVVVEGKEVKALVDSECFVSIVHSRLLRNCSGESRLLAFNGTEVKC